MPCCPIPALFLGLVASAQSRPSVPAAYSTRTATPPTIDGKLDDAVWQAAREAGELTQVEPNVGPPCSERTDIRFLHDSDHLYLAVRCYDGAPEHILSTTSERDARLEVDDHVELYFDTFHDGRNAFFFQLNAAGSNGDALIANNGAHFNKPWDGIWEGRATIDAQGWSAEFAFPFKTLNFKEGGTTWGFNLLRHLGRQREDARWANANRDFSFFSVFHAGELRGLEGMEQGIGLDIVPFFVAHERNDRVAGDKDLIGKPGLDLFYKLTPSLTFSLTLNTDFAETDVDERQINLTRFPLFFPERRDFFLQDAGLFQFGDGAVIPFFSRRIGLDASRQEVPILVGAKLTGRAGAYGIGVLDVRTDDTSTLDGQNLFATRVTKDVGEESKIGMIVTNGYPTGAGDNTVYGLDATWRTSRFRGDKTLVTNVFALESDGEGVSVQDSAFGFSTFAPSDLWSWRVGALEIQDRKSVV